tara:strand:+ start:556 stop:1059 length:504 start_codon:yes stop_codon:yes gene_type:complete
MKFRKYKNLIFFFSAFSLPLLTFSAPDWIKLNGIAPCWPVIWLLPFSLRNGPFRAAIASIFIGILMDSFTTGQVSYIPSLFLLSLAWGRYGTYEKGKEFIFNIGLLAILGTIVVGLSFWIQKIFLYSFLRNDWFHSWSIYALISEIIITGLVAPFFSSWLLLTYKKN